MNIPSAEPEPERYIGKPLLLLLENYILACIGELSPAQEQGIQAMVQGVFGGTDWRKTIRLTLQLGEDIDESLRQLWIRNQEIAKTNHVRLQPVQFAKMVADTNFRDLINSP